MTQRRTNKLSQQRRAQLAGADFAIPEERKFPIQSEQQAVTALTFARWPQNAHLRRRVEATVYARYPWLKPSAREKLAGHVAPPKAKRRSAAKLVRVANPKAEAERAYLRDGQRLHQAARWSGLNLSDPWSRMAGAGEPLSSGGRVYGGAGKKRRNASPRAKVDAVKLYRSPVWQGLSLGGPAAQMQGWTLGDTGPLQLQPQLPRKRRNAGKIPLPYKPLAGKVGGRIGRPVPWQLYPAYERLKWTTAAADRPAPSRPGSRGPRGRMEDAADQRRAALRQRELRSGVTARAARELEPVEIIYVVGPTATVRRFDGSITSYPVVELSPVAERQANRGGAQPQQLQRAVAGAFERRGWRVVWAQVNAYAYPASSRQRRYQIAVDGVHPQAHGRDGWTAKGRTVALAASLQQLQAQAQQGRR